jgi:hypothetical protein
MVSAAPTSGQGMRRAIVLAAPAIIAVPVLYGIAFALMGQTPMPVAFGIGAAGWVVALALRTPVGITAMRLARSRERAQTVVTASSGPLEETVRVLAVLLAGRELATALWLGLGWAAIEVVYTIVNGVAIAALADRTDPEAERVRALLPASALQSSAAAWGVAERAWASALHIGFTLIVAAAPIAFVVTAVVHSAINLGFLAAARRYAISAVSLAGVVVGGAILVIGLLLH